MFIRSRTRHGKGNQSGSQGTEKSRLRRNPGVGDACLPFQAAPARRCISNPGSNGPVEQPLSFHVTSRPFGGHPVAQVPQKFAPRRVPQS